MLIPGIARCGAMPGAIPALCRAGIVRSCAAFRARFGASTAQGWVVLQAKLLAALCLHAVATPRLQRLAAQPRGASRVLRTALRAPSPMDGHPAFFRRFQRRRCPPPSSPLTWPSGAPRWTLKSPDARPSPSEREAGLCPRKAFQPQSPKGSASRLKTCRLPQPGDPAPGAKAPHSPAPGRPVAFGSKLVDQARGTAPPACCPLARLASSLHAWPTWPGLPAPPAWRWPGSRFRQEATLCSVSTKRHAAIKSSCTAYINQSCMRLKISSACSYIIKTYAA